jgi:hypothetical protein
MFFLENPEKFGKHKCCGTQIDNYFRPATETCKIDQVIENLITFIGDSKLPINTITSDSFKNYSLSLIQIGQKNATTDPNKLLPQICRKKFTKLFINHSNQLFNNKLDLFRKSKGSCIAIDSGKHKTVPYLMVVLVNALIPSSPLIIEAVRFFKGKSSDYTTTIERILTSLLNEGINLVAIISDNLKSQVTAINHTNPQSIQQNTTNPKLASLLWISCSVHTLALALNDAAKECCYGDLINHIRSTATFLRSKNIVNILGIKCPLWAPTRWTGMYDIAFWMLKNHNKIFQIIDASLTHDIAYDFPDYIIDGLTIAASTAFSILLPFYHATHILEADNIPAAYTVPVINAALEHLNTIRNDLGIADELCNTIIACVTRRLSFSQTGKILQFLYTLTPLGRKEIRSNNELEISGIDAVDIEIPFSNKLSASEESIYNMLVDNPKLFYERAGAMKKAFSEYKGKLLYCSNSRKLIEHDGELHEDEEEEQIDIENISIGFLCKDESEEKVDSDDSDTSFEYYSDNEEEEFELADESIIEVTNGPLQDNIDTLKNIATLQGYSDSESMNIVTQYSDWLLDDPAEVLVHQEHLLKGHICWQYYSTYPKIKKLAKFAYPLMGIVASEASCERAFWQHRRITGDQGMKTGVALEKAKMFFATN